MKLYEEAEKCFLKTLDITDGIDSNINGSYAYLLHLMGDDEKAKKYIQIQIDLNPTNTSPWQWFDYGLINEEEEDESLKKAVDSVNTMASYLVAIDGLERMEEHEI